MRIADNPSWVEAIDKAIAAMCQSRADRGEYDSHDLINWLNEHSSDVLNEIINSHRFKEDGTPAQDPVLIATRQIARFIGDHRGQVEIGRHRSHRNTIQTEPSRAGSDSVVAVWKIPSNTSVASAEGAPNGPQSGNEPDEAGIASGLIHDRGRGPEIRGTRITVHNLLPYLLDPTATEDYIARANLLTPEQVAAARAYILHHPDSVLAEHLKIEERIAVGNSREVRERAKASRATFLRFKEWLADREKELAQCPEPTAAADGGGNRSGSLPTFREWLTQQEPRTAGGS